MTLGPPLVATAFVGPILAAARRLGGPTAPDDLARAVGTTVAELEDEDGWISLDVVNRLLAVASEQLGPTFAYDAGRASATPEALGLAYTLLRAFRSPVAAMRSLVIHSERYQRVADTELLEARPGLVRLRYATRPDSPPDNDALRAYRRGLLEAVPEIFGTPTARATDFAVDGPSGPTITEVRWTDMRLSHRRTLNLVIGLLIGVPAGVVLGLLGVPPPWPGTVSFILANIYLGVKELAIIKRARTVHDQEVRTLSLALEERRERLVALREAKRTLAEMNATLEERVASQGRELAQASKMAAMGTLVSGLCHELHNPNHVIAGQLALLRRDLPDDSRAARAAAAIERSSTRIRQLVDDMLAFARHGEHEAGRCSPNPIVVQAVADLRQRGGREVTLDASLADTTEVSLSARALESVIVNLLSNAFDATAAGGHIDVTLGLAGGRARLAVVDDGVGIPDALRPRVFEPFFTTKAPGAGTGLGLAIAWQIVTSAGGEIRATAGLARGAAFVVELPVAARAT